MRFSTYYPTPSTIVSLLAATLTLSILPNFCFGQTAIETISEQKATLTLSETQILWPDGAPGALGNEAKDQPKITVYRPEDSSETMSAILICPGGGYGGLAMDHEGKQIAQWMNQLGVVACVLDYRHRGKGYGHPSPMLDAQRGIRWIRSNALSMNIDPDKIGVIGFSAGGHLASTVSTHFDAGVPDAKDPIETVSCRPDFSILCYGVLQFGQPTTHMGSQRNLLGDDADPKLIESLSNDKQVTPETPPTFLWHTHEDTVVPPQNSAEYYLALKQHNVPAELHIFEKGRHGVGLAKGISGTDAWPLLCEKFLIRQGILSDATAEK